MRLLLFLLHFVCLRDLWDKLIQFKDSVIKVNFRCNPGDTDVFKAFSGRLKKVTTSYDQTRLRHNVWKKTFSRHLIYDIFRTSGLRRLEDVQFATFSKCLIYGVFRTFNLRRLEDVRFTLCWRHPIYDVLKTFDLRRLEDIWFMTSWRCLWNDICVATS